jgi:hypothetical protein
MMTHIRSALKPGGRVVLVNSERKTQACRFNRCTRCQSRSSIRTRAARFPLRAES